MKFEKPGDYLVQIVGVQLKVSDQGKEFVEIVFADTASPATIIDRKYLTDKAAEYSLKDLRTCGLGGDFSEIMNIIGNKVRIHLKEEEYEGKKKLKVRFINPENGLVGAGIAEHALSDLFDRMNVKIKSMKPAPVAVTKPSESDDIIPF